MEYAVPPSLEWHVWPGRRSIYNNSSNTSHHPSQTSCFPWISYATQKLMLDSCKMFQKQSEAFHTFLWDFFPSLKENFIAYRSFKVSSRPDCIFEIHQLWQSDFSRVYSNCCCSCSFEPEIIKIGQSSHNMYSNHHHHHVVLVARISLTLSRHFSLSFIALGRSWGQHPVSSHSCWMYIRAGRSAFARPCVGVHKSTSLMSSSLLLQQCPACLVRLTWIVFVIRGRWPYSWCLVGCCRQDLFKIARLRQF